MLLYLCINKYLIYKLSNLSEFFPVNESVTFHLLLIGSITIFSLIHTGAHIFNFITLNSSGILFVTTAAGITGILLTITLGLMYIFALNRNKNYNLFYYTHILNVLVITLLLLHGPFCFVKTNNGTCNGSSFWKWIIVPFSLYTLELLYRNIISNRKTTFVKIQKHSNNINEIELYKEKFEFKEGEWILVNCPKISKFEWHPFTITSNPIEFGRVSFHVKEQGDWTKKFVNMLLCNSENNQDNLVKISYPYGSKHNHINKYPVTILIAGGIGITTFFSLLKKLPCSMGHGNPNANLKNVHLYWICRNTTDFVAFLPRLQLINRDLSNLHINLYLTGNNDTPIFYPPFYFNIGRPNFDEILQEICNTYQNTSIKVIFCGSKQMNDSIYHTCNTFSKKKQQLLKNGNTLIFHKGELFT
jgi:NADPH oxidase